MTYIPGENIVHDGIWLLFIWVYVSIGLFTYGKLTYSIFHSEYKKDPNFERIPTALRYKYLIIIGISPFLLGFPLLNSGVFVGFNILYVLNPFFNLLEITIIEYTISLAIYVLYLFKFRLIIEQVFVLLIKKSIDYEIYFRSNAKNWGILTYGDPIYVNQNEYIRLAKIGKVLLHGGLVPISLIYISHVIINII